MSKSPLLTYIEEMMFERRYAKRTIEAHLKWIRCFNYFHGKRLPAQMGNTEVELFLSHLVVKQHVAPATQASALNALAFLFREVIKQPLYLAGSDARGNRKTGFSTYFAAFLCHTFIAKWR